MRRLLCGAMRGDIERSVRLGCWKSMSGIPQGVGADSIVIISG